MTESSSPTNSDNDSEHINTLGISDFVMEVDDPELAPTLSQEIVSAKKKWSDYGIIAATVYGFYGMILMLVIEPLSASGLGLGETYNLANQTDKGIGILEAVMFMLMGIGFGFAIRSFVIDRDSISIRMTQIIYLVFLSFGGLSLFISSLGTTFALSEAFGVFGPASGFWYILPYIVSCVSAFAAMFVFLVGQAKKDPAA